MSDWKHEVRVGLAKAGIADVSNEASRIIVAASLSDDPSESARSMVEQRSRGVPLEYVLGRVCFMGIEMLAEPGALVPRLETEVLGRGVESRIRSLDVSGELRIIDMCCGAGNLACALAVSFPNARVWASDLTDGCVAVAAKNMAFLGLSDRVCVCQGDLFAGVAGLGLESTVHAVVCNPPYISSGRLEKDRATLLEHEPIEAFDGGPYGLAIHQRVIRDSASFLIPGGIIAFEFGVGQERQLELLFRRTKLFDDVVFDTDNDGIPRAAFSRKKSE